MNTTVACGTMWVVKQKDPELENSPKPELDIELVEPCRATEGGRVRISTCGPRVWDTELLVGLSNQVGSSSSHFTTLGPDPYSLLNSHTILALHRILIFS